MRNYTILNIGPTEFSISFRRLVLALTTIVALLATAHVATNLLHYQWGHDYQRGFARQLNLDEEGNIPTWYSASTLLIASMLLTVIGAVKRRTLDPYSTHWLCLAGLFLFLSMDEAASIHEMLTLFDRFRLTEYLRYPWVIGGGLAFLAIGLSYLRFVLHLPSRIRWLFGTAAGLYVGGALGMESISGIYDERYGFDSLAYNLVAGVEEVYEMTGIVVFIYALTQYWVLTIETIVFTVRENPTTL